MSLKWRRADKLGVDSEQCNDPKRNVDCDMKQGLAEQETKNDPDLANTDANTTSTAQVVQPSSRAQLEADIIRVEQEMTQAGSSRNFAGALEKERELNRLIQLRDVLPCTSDLLDQLSHANTQLDTAIKARHWNEAKSLQDLLVRLERKLSVERDAETVATSHETISHHPLDDISLIPDMSMQRRSHFFSSSSIGLDGEILTDFLTVFLAAPLVWIDNNGTFHPFPLLDFQLEKKLLAEALKDAHEIGAEIIVRYEPATTDRLAAFLAADPSPVLHYSGHGHAEYLAIENEGAMQMLPVDQLRQFIAAGSGQLKVVFVSACHSKPAGDAFLKAGVPHVVCCRQSEQLRDSAAIEFARNFYRALACGKTLRESFQLARQAVMVSPSVVDAHVEMNKFLLLPEKPENDPYHDVQVFYTKPMRNRSVSSCISVSSLPTILPSPPDIFVGREITMYKVVKAVKESRCVQITGRTGTGKFALAAAVCRYIHDRTKSFFLDMVFWFSPSDEPLDDNELSTGFHEIFRYVRNEEAHCGEHGNCCRKITRALIDARALIFIDVRELKSTSELEKLDTFVQEILRRTEDVKIIVICPSRQDIASHSNAVKVVAVPPLDFYASVVLFGNWCPFVSEGHAVESPDDLVDLLVPDALADATTVSSAMSKRSCDIFRRVGEGIPAQIHAAATNMTKEQYSELIRIGQRSEPRAQINSRVELEKKILRLSDQIDAAVSTCNFLQAQELQDTLEELQNLRENLPSLEELKQMETKQRKELNAAISTKSFAKANHLQKALNELMARTRIEEEARLHYSYTLDSARTSETIGTPNKTSSSTSLRESNTVATNVEGDLDVASLLHNTAIEKPDPLKRILDPLRDLDDDLISEQMERFAPGTREWAVRSFDSWVSSDKKRHRVFVLVAQAGVGKTGIICKLARDRPEIVVGYHFCRHDDSRRSNPKNMLLSLAYQIAERFPDYRSLLDSIITVRQLSREELIKNHNVVALFELLLREPLSKLTVDKCHVVLIDALDECEGKNEILRCIQRHFSKLPPWLNVYATARPEFPIMDRLKKFNPTMIEPEVEDNTNDLRLFFGRLLDEYGAKELTHGPRRDKAIATLIEKSGGLFIYASFLADMVHSNGRRDLTLGVLEQFPQGLDEFYDVQFTRMFPDEECLEWRATKAVVAAAEPLHVDLIQAFVKCTRDERMVIIRKLSEFFPIDQNRKVHVYHKSLKDWLTSDDRQDSEFYVDLCEEERVLANGCLDILAESGITANKGDDKNDVHDSEVMTYALRHGVAHLCSAGMRHEARKLVLNVRWILARVEAGEAYEIVLDCQMLEKGDRVIELIGRAIGLSLNALRSDPHQLPGQLIGRLLGSTLGRRQEDSVRQELSEFVDSVQNFRYGFKWWCPLLPTWDQAEQPCLRTLVGHTSGVKSVAFSKDGTKIVSSSNDQTVRIWDALTGHCEHVLEGHKGCVHSVALLESRGTKIASGSEDRTIRIWDAFGECEQILEEKGTGKVLSVAWFKDGTKIAGGSGDCSVRVWNILKGECEKLFTGHKRPVVSVALSPDCSRLISGSFDKTSRIWNVATGACEHVLIGASNARVHSVAWSSRDANTVFGSWGKSIRIFDADEGGCEGVMEDTSVIVSMALSEDDSKLACGMMGNYISVWDTNTGLRTGILKGHAKHVYAVAWSNNGTRIVSGSTDRSIRIWDATAVERKSNEGSDSTTPDQGPRSKDKPSASRNGGRKAECLKHERHTSRVNRVSWSDDGSMVATASSDRTIRLWDPTTGRCVRVLKSQRYLRTVAWSRDGAKLVSGSFDGATCIWDATTGECERVLNGHTDQVLGVKWCNHGSLVCTGSQDKSVRIWDAATGECKLVLQGHEGFVNSVGWSEDDSKVGSASSDNSVRIWDAASGECLHVLEGHTEFVYSVRWSGSNLVSRSHDDTARIWDPTTGECKEIIKTIRFTSPALECDRFYRDRKRACGVHYNQSVNFFVEKD